MEERRGLVLMLLLLWLPCVSLRSTHATSLFYSCTGMRLSGGCMGSDGVRGPRLSKLGLAAVAAVEGKEVLVPAVLADNDSDDEIADKSAVSTGSDSSPSSPGGVEQDEKAQSRSRVWSAEEIQEAHDRYYGRFFTDPSLPLTPLSADGSISKHKLQGCDRDAATPQSGERAFFHFELYYEDMLAASSCVHNKTPQPALSLLLGSGEAGSDDSAWELILRSMSRGEQAMLVITQQQRQQELLQPVFMAAAHGIGSAHILGRKPLRLIVETFAFGRERLLLPAALPRSWFRPCGGEGANMTVEGVGAGDKREGEGDITYECLHWGRGDASPKFGDEVLVRVAVSGCEVQEGWVRLGNSSLAIGVEFAIACMFRSGGKGQVTVTGSYVTCSDRLGVAASSDATSMELGAETVLAATASWAVEGWQELERQRWHARGGGGKVIFDVEVIKWNDVIDCAAVCPECTTWPSALTLEEHHDFSHSSTPSDQSSRPHVTCHRPEARVEKATRQTGTLRNRDGLGVDGLQAWCGLRAWGASKACTRMTCNARGCVIVRRHAQSECSQRILLEGDEAVVSLSVAAWWPDCGTESGEMQGRERDQRASPPEVLELTVEVGSGQLPLGVELALLHCRVPGAVQVIVAACDAGFCSLRGLARTVAAPLFPNATVGRHVGAWIFDVEAKHLVRRVTNQRSSASLAGAEARLAQGTQLFSESHYVPALHKFAAARRLIQAVKCGSAGRGRHRVGSTGARLDSIGELSGAGDTEEVLRNLCGSGESGLSTGRSCGVSDDDEHVHLLGKKESGASGGDGEMSSGSTNWLSREDSVQGNGGGLSEDSIGAGGREAGERDWVDRSESTAGSVAYGERMDLRQDVLQRTLLNAAACLLHLGLPAQAEEACTQILHAQSCQKSVGSARGKGTVATAKALFRRGKARTCMGMLTEAEEDLRNAMLLQPGSEAIQRELRAVQRRQEHALRKAMPGLLPGGGKRSREPAI